jgi:hypothetical protein
MKSHFSLYVMIKMGPVLNIPQTTNNVHYYYYYYYYYGFCWAWALFQFLLDPIHGRSARRKAAIYTQNNTNTE